jgi:hypothetical protein
VRESRAAAVASNDGYGVFSTEVARGGASDRFGSRAVGWANLDRAGLLPLPPLGSGHHHVDNCGCCTQSRQAARASWPKGRCASSSGHVSGSSGHASGSRRF